MMDPKRQLTEEDIDQLRFLFERAIETDGCNQKQWYLESIAGTLHIDLPDHEPGIAP